MFAYLEEQLEFDFQFNCPFIEAKYYREGAEDLIKRLVPVDLLNEDPISNSSQRARFSDMLPFICWSELSKAPCALSVILLCRYRLNACNFFYDMVSRWLLPQQRVNVELFFASDVRLPHLSDELLSVAEIVVHLKSASDVEQVRRNLHSIETEIRLGVVSNYHARRILEFKGLSADGKTAMIQEKIGSLIQSHSKDFDQGIFSQMQQFLVCVREDFKNLRDYHHISRVISNLHSMKQLLKQNIQVFPDKRHISVKFLKTKLNTTVKKDKPVLGVIVGLNFMQEHEVFEASHLINAIQKNMAVKMVEGSLYLDKAEVTHQIIYLEIEKLDGFDFTLDEIQKLKQILPDQIKLHIERLTHSIFMPRNEEEVLKNIMNLARQIRFVSDIPQIIISFDEQKGTDLHFTVILVRLISDGTRSLQELFSQKKSLIKYIPDRIRRVGNIRRKYTKEATVFRTILSNGSFLRSDHSVDLYKARTFIFDQISKVLGDVRDYNGGMIFKLTESLSHLKASLGKSFDPILIEKFFYSLSPIEMRSSLGIEPMKQLFLYFMQLLKSEKKVLFKQESNRVFAILQNKSIKVLNFLPHQLVSFMVDVFDVSYCGYLLLSESVEDHEKFIKALEPS